MKIRKVKSALLAVATLALLTQAAQAASVSIQQEVDLAVTPISSGPPQQIFEFFDSANPVTISSGDSVKVTYSFLNGRLTMGDLVALPNTYEFAYPWLSLLGSSGGRFGISNIRITFLDAVAAGGVESEFTFASQQSGNVQLGPALVSFLPSGSSLNFSGIEASYTVDFIPGGIGTYKPFLVLNADQLAVTPIPEPPTHIAAALLLFGMQVYGRLRRPSA